ncbi:MAG: restriction endonuclease subunit S [Holophagales bacterium]|nr:MAG: restriction endonuclease subunit S [Holophagales bacterium]
MTLDCLYEFSSGLSKPRTEFGTGFPFLSFKDVFDNYFVPRELKERVRSTEQERRALSVKRGDVFLTRTSETVDELGMSCVALRDIPDATFNGFTKRLRPRPDARVAPEYAGYYFRGPEFRSQVYAMSSLSTRASLNSEMLSRLTIRLPSTPVQERIGAVLKALDDKIDLNRRMSETLEAMAQALFKSWFVDFEPVRAKAAGYNTGLGVSLGAVFPAELAESDVGEIPAGWLVQEIGDLLELAYGKALRAEDRKIGTVPVYGSNGQVGWHDQRLVSGPGIVVGRKGNPGVVTWVPTDFFPIDTTFFVIPKLDCRSLEFLFFALQDQGLSALGADSAVPGVNRNLIYQSKQILPSPRVLEEFSRIAGSLLDRSRECVAEAQVLGALRDALLPGLISGDLMIDRMSTLGGRG